MKASRFLALAAGSLLCASALAQNCTDNVYAAHLVTATGAELPTFFDPVVQSASFQAPTEHVFLAFDPNIPSGTYYVHVTDNPVDGLDEVVSNNDPMDRFVAVTNTGGVITLSLPFSSNPGAQEYGVGLNGVGQSLRLYFGPSQYTQCRFKVWLGDNWDLSGLPRAQRHPSEHRRVLDPLLHGAACRRRLGQRHPRLRVQRRQHERHARCR
jgi:hypothetical protein